MRLLLAASIVCLTSSGIPAGAEPRSAKDCAGIDESFAYNDCIAKFGPSGAGKITSHGAATVYANAPLAPTPIVPQSAAGAVAPDRAAPQRSAAPPMGRPAAGQRVTGSIYQRSANGRYFAVFQIGQAAAAAKSAVPAAKAAPRRVAPAAYYRWRGYRRH